MLPIALAFGAHDVLRGRWDNVGILLSMSLSFLSLMSHIAANGFRPSLNKTRLTSVLADAVPRLQHPAVSAFLLDVYLFQPTDESVQNALKQALITTDKSEIGSFTPRHFCALYRILKGPSDASLQRAALAALTRVGTADSVPHIERLSSIDAKEKWQCELRMAAAECLESLRARLAAEQASATLLRAADGSPDRLLQPAAAPAAQDADVLLRSTND